MKSEPIELPPESIQQSRWMQNDCIFCGDRMPQDAGYSMQYCGPECRVAMTKARRQDAAQRAVME
jgi:predicted nucleic acid-binding Zn ribbon protein